MSYKKVGWEDSPSSNTPILSVSLNQMDDGIEKANKGIAFGYSATFTSDGVIKKTTSASILQPGDFATSQTDITTAYVSNAVTKIGSGTFANCTSLKTIYIDNTVGNVEIVSGAVPDGVSIVYSNDDNFINVNELLASAIKSLKKQVNADKSDWENRATNIEEQASSDKSELSQAIQGVKESALEEFASVKADLDKKENISNKVDTINFPSTTYYPSSKAVWDYVNSKLSTLINDIENLKNNKVNVTDFNTFKDTTNKTIANHSTNINTNANNIETMKADLDKKDKVIKNLTIKNTTEKSTGVVLNDSSDCNIVNLICDEKDDSNQIAFYRKNLFDFNSIRVYGNSSASNVVVNKNSKSISFTTSETSVNSGIYIRHASYQDYKGYGVDYTKLGGKPVALSFDVQSDINCKIGIEFIKASYKYFDITSEKQRIVVTDTVDINKLNKALCFYTNKTKANITISNIQIEVNNTATDYEDCDYQKVTLTDADVNSLHTYYPSTTVISDSDCILTYVADNKNYIDNKILEVATALVASESEVM